ncbi:hypothetical protein SAMN05519103_02583 [Rhizobiales bacterium GAS113]|nr:hypothetical protein SAMN05519103_02583 [Rhizobiales bacterium GAS113]
MSINGENASILVRSLLRRLVQTGDVFQLPGVISVEEVAALRMLIGEASTEPISATDAAPQKSTPKSTGNPIPAAEPREPTRAVSLVTTSLNQASLAEGELRLCLDFGTAMSKAWATGRSATDVIPLALGRPAGTGNVLSIPSSIFISDTGKVHLGLAAERSHRDAPEGRSRFDNLKMMLSDAEIGRDLDDAVLHEDVNPTATRLSEGDMLVLFIAWLTDMALIELRDSIKDGSIAEKIKEDGKSIDCIRYVRRRFAIPCFETARDEETDGSKRAAWARDVMKRSVLRAQIVADSLHGKWDKITVQDVRSIMDQVGSLELSPLEGLLTEVAAIREPIAAGASIFDEHLLIQFGNMDGAKMQRRYVMVVDAGAGTTDFALFQVFFDPRTEMTRYALLGQSVSMSRLAGNEVDRVLEQIMLETCGVTPSTGNPLSSTDFRIARNHIRSQVRELKSVLFGTGEVRLDIRPRLHGVLKLEIVEADPRYIRLEKDLIADQEAVLAQSFNSAAHQSFQTLNIRFNKPVPIYVVLTGGSSHIPIFKNLNNRITTISGSKFKFEPLPSTPGWISTLPREISGLVGAAFAQQAVAIGGSVPELPREMNDLVAPIVSPPEGSRVLDRYQVTGVG